MDSIILIPRMRDTVVHRVSFQKYRSLAQYATRIFRNDPECNELHELLYELDVIVNDHQEPPKRKSTSDICSLSGYASNLNHIFA
jgi:hypothetical protein